MAFLASWRENLHSSPVRPADDLKLLTVILFLGIAVAGCSLTPEQMELLQGQVERQQATSLTCPSSRTDRCAEDTPLAALAGEGRHYLVPLEIGADALAARVHLIRAARERIEFQNYIFYGDASGQTLLDELIAAARRGVRVRLLVDALFSLPDLDLLRQLVTAHERFEVRLYNPPLGHATLSNGQFVGSVLCCFRRLNHRMHFKLVAIDDRFAILGGRNGADRYFDLDTRMNFRDFEVMVTGPEVPAMRESFDAYWHHPRTVPAWRTRDLARHISTRPVSERPLSPPDRATRVAEQASDPDWQQQRLMARAMAVDELEYFWDPAERPYRLRQPSPASQRIYQVIAGATDSVRLQTPYFVMPRRFREALEELPEPVSVQVSTNSLASTDAYPTYAIQRRQRHIMLDELGLEIFEFKPYPADRHHYVPRYAELIAEKAAGITSPARGDPAAVTREAPGPRISVHAKLVVVDDEVSIVTSHNFDPRSERYNTENGIIVGDRGFARFLSAEIERDMAPRNAWYVGPRPNNHPASALSHVIAGWSRRLPVLDLWPARQTQNYQLLTGTDPVPWWHEDFIDTWQPVGEVPDIAQRRRLWTTGFISRMLGFLKPIM